MYKIITLILLLLSLCGYTATAQSPESEMDLASKEQQALDFDTLTLEGAIAFALKHSPAIAEAELTVALAELDLKRTQFWKRLLPSLTLHHGYNPLADENRVGIGLSFSLNQIFAEGERAKEAKLKWFNAEIYQKTVGNGVVLSVTGSYYDWVTAKKQVELLEDQLSASMKLSELQKLQFESGQEKLASLVSGMQQVATTQLALLRAQAEVELRELKLKNDIGWEQGAVTR